MAKKARRPLNRTVDPDTYDQVKVLAKLLECSEGEVIDRAVMGFAPDTSLVKPQEVPNGEPTPEFKAYVEELVERVRQLPQLEDIGTLLGHLLESRAAPIPGYVRPERPESVPSSHTINCLHCGERGFGATKHATVCSGCKSEGHTNAPAECPRCTEGGAL